MLFPNVANEQLQDEASRLNRKFDVIIDRAFATLPIQPRIEQARADLEKMDINYILFLRTALQQRGLRKEADSLSSSYHAVKIAADLSSDEPIDIYHTN